MPNLSMLRPRPLLLPMGQLCHQCRGRRRNHSLYRQPCPQLRRHLLLLLHLLLRAHRLLLLVHRAVRPSLFATIARVAKVVKAKAKAKEGSPRRAVKSQNLTATTSTKTAIVLLLAKQVRVARVRAKAKARAKAKVLFGTTTPMHMKQSKVWTRSYRQDFLF